MELGEYLNVLKRHMVLFAVIIIICSSGAGLLAATTPDQVDVSTTLDITVDDLDQTTEYKFDGFYAQQSSELFSDTVVGWLESPDVVVAIYQRADLPEPSDDVRDLAKVFTASKLSSQNVEVRFHHAEEDEARKLVEAMKAVLFERTQRVDDASEGATNYEIVFSDPLVRPKNRQVGLVTGVGAGVGVILGFGVVFLREYFMPAPQATKKKRSK